MNKRNKQPIPMNDIQQDCFQRETESWRTNNIGQLVDVEFDYFDIQYVSTGPAIDEVERVEYYLVSNKTGIAELQLTITITYNAKALISKVERTYGN